jgi:uncharacterized protein (TIGR03437 family)
LPAPSAITFPQQIHVNAFSIDSLDPATILVATSIGLFGTNGAGQLWGQRNTGLNVSGSGYVSVVNVFYNPVNPLVAYAVTSGPSYLFASSDAGNTWRLLEPSYPGEPLEPKFTYSPNLASTITTDGSTLYAINGNGTLLASLDGGTSWIKLMSGFFAPVSIQVDPSNPSTLYVLDSRTLHKSTDGGATFANIKTTVFPRSLAVDANGAVYVGADNPPIYVSTDGGATFSPVPNLTGSSIPTLSVSGNNVYVGTPSPSTPFVIKLDPSGQTTLFSTFLGGSSYDTITGLAVDAQGDAVVGGIKNSSDFPLTTPPSSGKNAGFITKLSADGASLIYSIATVGLVQAVALDPVGNVLATGQVSGAVLATTPSAFQTSVPSTPCNRPSVTLFGPAIQTGNAFVSKISADGQSILYTTYLTGSCGSYGSGITADSAGDAIVTGNTTSANFPVTAGSYQSAFPGPADKTTYPGGILTAGFVSILSPSGDKLLAGTYLGGGYSTQAASSLVDGSGNVYITGSTQGFASGATPGAYQTKFVDQCIPTVNIGPGPPYTGTADAFVLKLDPALSTARFLTYLGGGCNDSGRQIALDSSGNVWVTGTTVSSDFPVSQPFESSGISSSAIPGFVSELSADGSQLLFSSFSQTWALASGRGSIYLAGSSGPSALVGKLDPAQSSTVSIDSISPVVVFPPPWVQFYGGVAPGQLIRIIGHNLGPTTKISGQADASGHLPFILGNTIVFFDNVAAPLFSVSATEIVCFVPFEAAAQARVSVSFNGQSSAPVLTGIVGSSPQVLSIVNQDGSANSADHPAKPGSVITIYVTGLGQTSPPGADGLMNSSPLPVPIAPVTVYFPATPSSATPKLVSAAPGMPAGMSQVIVQLPAMLIPVATQPVAISVNNTYAQIYTAQ